MPVSRLEYLFNRHAQFNCTADEEEELMALMAQPENEAEVQALISKVITYTGAEMQLQEHRSNAILHNILQADKTKEEIVPVDDSKKEFILWKAMAAAAVILFMAGVAYWVLGKKKDKEPLLAAEKHSPVVLPGGNKAMLTIADGRILVLDSMQNGMLTEQGGTRIKKHGSILIYDEGALANAPFAYNTLSTPRGGQYQVVLPDGSKVWLNAASSLRFPTAFTGSQRLVELTGEAYFEVTKNKQKPFHVKVSDMQVEVLGTHFNINAYGDEGTIKTSLLEGSVKVTKGSTSALLKPGQQGVLDHRADKLKVADADMNEVMAWKNGLFHFEGADISSIMQQIGRWYDVDIVFSGKISRRRFEGKINRNAQLSEVLQILELSNVKFSVEGKKIIVR